jgi:hypothetical protein
MALCRNMFGDHNRPFIVAVWSGHPAVVAVINRAEVDGLTVPGVAHLQASRSQPIRRDAS